MSYENRMQRAKIYSASCGTNSSRRNCCKFFSDAMFDTDDSARPLCGRQSQSRRLPDKEANFQFDKRIIGSSKEFQQHFIFIFASLLEKPLGEVTVLGIDASVPSNITLIRRSPKVFRPDNCDPSSGGATSAEEPTRPWGARAAWAGCGDAAYRSYIHNNELRIILQTRGPLLALDGGGGKFEGKNSRVDAHKFEPDRAESTQV